MLWQLVHFLTKEAYSRVEASLGKADKESDHVEAPDGCDFVREEGADAPGNFEERQPPARRDSGED